MSNKKGFTLVELLAVIAILAILVVLITPNVIKMYENGKKEAFEVQIRKLIKAAEARHQSDSLEGKINVNYCDFDELCPKSVHLTNDSSDLKYAVIMDSDKAAGVAVQDSNYCYMGVGNPSIINKDDFVAKGKIQILGIDNDSISVSCGDNTITIPYRTNYAYWNARTAGAGVHYSSTTKPSVTVAFNTMLGVSDYDVYNRTYLSDDNGIIEHQVCLVDTNYLSDVCYGPWIIHDTIERMKQWSEGKKIFSSCTTNSNGVTCNLHGSSCTVVAEDKVYCTNQSNKTCTLDVNGEAWCD